ncbi:hypothetical protein M501DRAFT_1043103 [Patellaria atrata CBS 101060]|uniref:F-box domain-containing protein n=1 Tax=Patellaria atrata CBS 101060 TaxID=1346257 RepID=A0A9P4VUS9_9PEZI|nr:hypothetical protein M501DRAFT_1043103 [Patellaria atrata CBS 101060]
MPTIPTLPPELTLLIISHLHPSSFVSFAKTCRANYILCLSSPLSQRNLSHYRTHAPIWTHIPSQYPPHYQWWGLFDLLTQLIEAPELGAYVVRCEFEEPMPLDAFELDGSYADYDNYGRWGRDRVRVLIEVVEEMEDLGRGVREGIVQALREAREKEEESPLVRALVLLMPGLRGLVVDGEVLEIKKKLGTTVLRRKGRKGGGGGLRDRVELGYWVVQMGG